MMREKNQSDRESESKIKNDIHIYTHMNIDRKIPHYDIDPPHTGGAFFNHLDGEMVRRGWYKTEEGKFGMRYTGDLTPIIEECDKHIIERTDKTYAIKNLSLLSLIESFLIETYEENIPIDPLKIEILLILFKKFDIFKNKKDLMETFHESKSLDKALFFFSVLQSYLFSVGKMLVVQQKHDYLINKTFDGDVTLTPADGYDSKYGYFSDMETLYF
jgi:hypothetical protein